MSNNPIEEKLRTLTLNEVTVLYWKCQNLKYEKIALEMNYGVDWVQLQMSNVYAKLGFNKEMHWSKRVEILNQEVCPALTEILKSQPPKPNEWPPDMEKPEPNPETYPLVLYDQEKDEEEPPPPPPEPIIIPAQLPGPQRRNNLTRILTIGALLACLGCLVVGAGAYFLGRGGFALATETVIPSVPPTLTIVPSPTIQLTNTETPPPTNTLTPTLTFTPTSTVTPIPTNTKPPIGLVKGDELRDSRVTLKLKDVIFNIGYDRIGSRRAPVAFIFEFTNHSGETIVVQFDSSHFVIQDNTGRTAECWFYTISGAVDKWTSNLNDNSTLEIATRCGDGNVPSDVTMYTMTVHPFTSLPESTWVASVPR